MNRMKVYAHVSGAGLTLFAAVITGLLLGQFLDGLAGTGALFTLLLIVLGTAGGVINLLRVVGNVTDGNGSDGKTI